MDADVFSKHREERQKARLRDRGGMWKPVTPGRMAHDLLSKYRPRPPPESPTKPRKSVGGRKSIGAGILPRKSLGVGRKSVGAPRKSVAAKDDDGAAKKAKPKAASKKLAIKSATPADGTNAQGKRKVANDDDDGDDLPPVKPKSKAKASRPLFMTTDEPVVVPVKPPKKPVHPALSGAPLLNQPAPPPRLQPQPQPEPSKKRPRDYMMPPTSEASEFIPSSPPPAKRARTKAKPKMLAPVEEDAEEIDLALRDEDEDEAPPVKAKLKAKPKKEAGSSAARRPRTKKAAAVDGDDDAQDGSPVASSSKTKAKAKTAASKKGPNTKAILDEDDAPKTKAKPKAKSKVVAQDDDDDEAPKVKPKAKSKPTTRDDDPDAPSTSTGKDKPKPQDLSRKHGVPQDADPDDLGGKGSTSKVNGKTGSKGGKSKGANAEGDGEPSVSRGNSNSKATGAPDAASKRAKPAPAPPVDDGSSKRKPKAKSTDGDDDARARPKSKARNEPASPPTAKPARKRKAVDDENQAAGLEERKRKRAGSPQPEEYEHIPQRPAFSMIIPSIRRDSTPGEIDSRSQKTLRPAMTPGTRRRRIEAVLSNEDSPVKTMHRKYDGLPDPIDCFL
ncbi:hypothetical protein AURDEDRAFT_114442 [Auricularia subglabra TFB-10046 SS5]|nr:hypothetical protein AURDEDRAFT_114442 [Auricularia subglabra TFB-10046 SS5]